MALPPSSATGFLSRNASVLSADGLHKRTGANQTEENRSRSPVATANNSKRNSIVNQKNNNGSDGNSQAGAEAVPAVQNAALSTKPPANNNKLNYVSSRSREWAISAHWFGNLLSTLTCVAVLSALAALSNLRPKLVLPQELILYIVISEAVITVLSISGCFLRSIAVKALSSVMKLRNKNFEYQELAYSSVSPVRGRRTSGRSPPKTVRLKTSRVPPGRSSVCCMIGDCNVILLTTYFLIQLALFAWRLVLVKTLIDWMTTVRQSQEFTFEMTSLNLTDYSHVNTTSLENIRRSRITFDEMFKSYYLRMNGAQWQGVQNRLGCCGYVSLNMSLNLTRDAIQSGSTCSENDSTLAHAFNASCSYALQESSRSQSRLLVTIIIAVGFIQAVNLVVLWELVYPACAALKSNIWNRCKNPQRR